jgi:uncharacterized protein
MKCPRCSLVEHDAPARCPGCGFSIADLDRRLGAPPARPEFLLDEADVLDDDAQQRLTARLRELGARSHGPIVVVTRSRTAPVTPAEYAFWLFNRWQLGAPNHRALLLLLALREQRIETEVGYGLESVATDAATARVLAEHAVPLLRQREYAAALEAAVDTLGTLLAAEVSR